MSLWLSVYLDLIRVAAALVVFFDHVGQGNAASGLTSHAYEFAQDAVLVFFVLSGFVIGHSVDTSHDDLRKFVIKRVARIYSVAVPALFLTIGLDAIRQSWHAGASAFLFNLFNRHVAVEIISGLLFTTEFWSWHFEIGSNGAYWSLGYEIWYYAAFAALYFGRRIWGIILASGLMLMTGPQVALFFLIWLIGLGSYYASAKIHIGKIQAIVLILFSSSAALLLAISARRMMSIYGAFGLSDVNVKSYVFYGLLATLFSVNIIAIAEIGKYLTPLPLGLVKFVRHLGNQTFPLYLMHMPVLAFITPLLPWKSTSWQTQVTVSILIPGLIFPVGYFLEHRKARWRQLVERFAEWLGWLSQTNITPTDSTEQQQPSK